MNYIAPFLVVLSLLASYAARGDVRDNHAVAVVTATVTDPSTGQEKKLYSNLAFPSIQDCQALLDKPPEFLKTEFDSMRAAAAKQGLKVEFKCELVNA